MREDTITLSLKEVNTPEELAEMAKKLAGKLADMETVASEKSAADATFNERKKVLQAEVETLYRQYNKGYEMAQVGCDIRYNDPAPGQKSYYRMDSALLVETVDMTWEEKQEELQFNLGASAEEQPQPSAEQVDATLESLASEPASDDAEKPTPADAPAEDSEPRKRGRRKAAPPPPNNQEPPAEAAGLD